MSDTPRRYQWPDDYFRSERVFRVARATKNLYRQIRALGPTMPEDAMRFESAVISRKDVEATNTPVNYTTYRPLLRGKNEEEQKQLLEEQKSLLESINTDLLFDFLEKHAVKHCDPNNITQLRTLYAKEPRFSDPDDIQEAYLQLVALYSRIPVKGYAAQELNIQHFKTQTSASFFLIHAEPQVKGLHLINVWACTPDSPTSWKTERTAIDLAQIPDPDLANSDEFLINHLLRVVRNQEKDPDRSNKQPSYYFIAIPIHTLHPSSPFQRSIGTFLGWLYVHCDPWDPISPETDLENHISPIVLKLWPLLDDYASSLLDGEIEERLANFGRAATQNPLQFVKDQVSNLSGWVCDDTDPTPDEVRNVKYYKLTDKGRLLLVLMPAQAGREAVAIRLAPKKSTIVPQNEDDYLREYGSKRFCHRIRSFYEQAMFRQSAMLAGQAQVTHTVSYTIRTTLTELRDLSVAMTSLRETPEMFPIADYTRLPPALRKFRYPVQLYAVALENACKYEHDEEKFCRWLPTIEWIDNALAATGLEESLLLDLSNQIAKPLARMRLRQLGRSPEKVDACKPVVNGSLSADVLKSVGNVKCRIVIAVVVELLREAFQHCSGEQPSINVVLTTSPITITVTNSCSGERATDGNSPRVLNTLMGRLSNWSLSEPKNEDSEWSRQLVYHPRSDQLLTPCAG